MGEDEMTPGSDGSPPARASAEAPACRHTSAQFMGAAGVRLHLHAWLPAAAALTEPAPEPVA
ncbi:MAG: hypothetical protein IH629_02615, partial [Thermoleophilia bacterium]|nr:hypothetical protein [Thermoleophilia bacterium]